MTDSISLHLMSKSKFNMQAFGLHAHMVLLFMVQTNETTNEIVA